MSSLGPSGSNAHTGLNFSQAGLRRNAAFATSHPSQHQANRQSPTPHAASPYQPQAYAPQQPPQGVYTQHLFSQTPVNTNGHPRSRTPNTHVSNAINVQRQRAAPPRQQMQYQLNPPPLMFSSGINQPVQHEPLLSHPQHPQHPQHPHPQHQQHQQQSHSVHQPHSGHHSQQQQQQQQHQQQQPHQHQQHAQKQAHHQQQQTHQAHQAHPGHPAHQTHPAHQAHQGHQGHQGRQSHPSHPHPQHRKTPQSQQQQQPQKPQHPQHPQNPQHAQHQHQHPQASQAPQPQQHTPQPQPQPMPQSQAPAQQQTQVPQVPQLPHVQQVQQVQASPQQQPETLTQQQDDATADDMDLDSHNDTEYDTSVLDSKLLNDPSFMPSQPMGDMMSPPPEGGSYPTLEAVQKAVLRYCTSVGYAIVIGRSKKTVPGLKKVLFVCDRAGKPPSRVSPEFRKRKTSSRKCDCPFGFFAIEQRTQWTIRYRPNPAHLQHNHGPSESPSHHPAARKLDSKMVSAVKHLKENGMEPKIDDDSGAAPANNGTGAGVSETLQILQTENPDCHFLPRDIYNARAAINRNPQKVATGLAEDRPAIYTKPQQTSEDRIRADLRRELAKAREDLKKIEDEKQKEIDDLKTKLEEKETLIKKFETFIDICNQRVMVQRERLAGPDGSAASGGNLTG